METVSSIANSSGPFTITQEELKAVQDISFKSLSKSKQEGLPPIKPKKLLEICPEASKSGRWKKFWKELYKHEWSARNDFTALHLFNFGSYVPLQFTNTDVIPQFRCHLCLSGMEPMNLLRHLYNECEITKYWWREVGNTKQMNVREMLAPKDVTYENLKNLNWFVKVVQRVYSVRCREDKNGVVLGPLSDRLLSKALHRVNPMGR